MKKIFCALFIVSMISIIGCKRESDILATYKDGNITRGDFYKWLEANRFQKDTILKSKSRQKERIEKMAIELLTIAQARAEGFDKSEEFQKYSEFVSQDILIRRLYDKEIKEKAHFKEPAIKVRYILLRVKEYEIDPKQKNKRVNLGKDELEKKYNETILKGKEIIEKLDKGESFEALAKQYSDDFSKAKGGDIGYITRDMMPPDFSAPAFSLKKGEYTKEPVRTSRGVYVIKVEDTKELTDKNIEKVIGNKSQAMRIKSGVLRSYSKEFIDKLLTASDVKINDDKVLSKNATDVIFQVGDKNYTVADLNKQIELRSSRTSAGNMAKINITDDQRKNMAKTYFQYEVLKRDAINKGIDKDPEYLQDMRTRTNSILAREYTNKIFSTDIKITANEIKAEYDKNKENSYYKMVNKGNKRVKQIEPFNSVKDRIERNLLNRKKSEQRKNWTAQILKDYNFKIDESKLEGK